MPMQLFQHAFHHDWLDIEAEVTDCTFVRGSATGDLIGTSLGNEVLPYFAIGFTYTVGGRTYEGETRSPDAVQSPPPLQPPPS